jgi:hypothetical protein
LLDLRGRYTVRDMRPDSWLFAFAIMCGSASARADEECVRRVNAMRQRLDKLPDHPPAVEVAIDALPVGSVRRAITEEGMLLVVQKDFPLVLDDQNLGEDDAVAAKVIGESAEHAAILYVAAVPGERWARVLHALAAVPPSVELRLIVIAKHAAISAREVASIVAGLQKTAGSCSGVLEAFANASSYADSHRWHHIKREVPDAVAACTCEGVDVKRLTDHMLRLGSPAAYGWLKLPASPVKLAASATVADLAKRLR